MPFPQRLVLVVFLVQGLPFMQKVHHPFCSDTPLCPKTSQLVDWKSMAQVDCNARQLVSGVGPSPKCTDCPRKGSHLSGLRHLLIPLL
jgi:hypothetical protein